MKILHHLLPAVVLLAPAVPASAAIVYSGAVNIPVPYTFNGVYLNVVTGATSLSEPPDFYGSPSAAWINLAFAGVDVVTGDGLAPAALPSGEVVNIPYNTLIDSTGAYVSGPNASSTHLGPGPGQFTASTPGYIGFRINPSGAGDQFGWIRVSLNDDNSGGTIHGYAYETIAGLAIPAGVPEPGTTSVILLTATTLLLRRRTPGNPARRR
jgi:hypothetical protein